MSVMNFHSKQLKVNPLFTVYLMPQGLDGFGTDYSLSHDRVI